MAGKSVRVLQWCNDWFSIEVAGKIRIVSPIYLRLTSEERDQVVKSAAMGDAGTLLAQFLLKDDGTFVRRQRL